MEITIPQLLSQFGPAGLFIAYLIWDRKERSAESDKRLEADKATASALASLTTLLTTFVTGKREL